MSLVRTATPGPDYRPNVGIMLLNPAGLAWVGRRIDTPDAWQMPQGGIDPGETPRAAALRELSEETGIATAEIIAETADWLLYELPPSLSGKAWKGKWRGQAQRWFAMRFTGRERDIDIAQKHAEFDAYRWVPRTTLVDLIVPFKRPVYAAVIDEFKAPLKALGF